MKQASLTNERVECLYDYLMCCAVGYENKKSAKEIINDSLGLFKDRRDVESTIKRIRCTKDRKVGSSGGGYWLCCSDDEVKGDAYMIKQACAKMEVAIRSGVNPNIFYNHLNNIKQQRNNVADTQQKLISENDELETRRLSDDLKSF